jgi:tetrahedral aminopeptidase
MNTLNTELLKNISLLPSPSNNEEALINYVHSLKFKNFKSEIAKDGSLNFFTENDNSKKTVLIDAHIDQVHLRVVGIDKKGFLIVKSIGFDMDVALGNNVFHLESGLKGVIGPFPPHLRIGIGANDKRIGYCDLGIPVNEVTDKVEPGDVIMFEMKYEQLGDNKIIASGLDNKIGGFILLELIEYFSKNFSKLKYNLICHFSTREEIGLGSFAKNMKNKAINYIIVLDTSPASDQKGIPYDLLGDIKLGNGPVLSRNYEDNYTFGKNIRKIGKKIDILPQLTFTSGYGASNARTYSRLFDSMVQYIGIPIRYIHSPSEMIDLRDAVTSKKLLIELLTTNEI